MDEKENILISVIIPIYNVEQYLQQCIDSVLMQEVCGMEIILIDDGSTDNSRLIAEKYAEAYPNVHLFSQKNKRQGAARNFGLYNAKGKYVYFLDSDDYIVAGALNRLWETAEKLQAEVVLFAGEAFMDLAEGESCQAAIYSKKGTYSEVQTGEKAFQNMLSNGEYTCHVCLQFSKREFLLKNEIFFPEGIIHEDELYSYKLFLSSHRVGIIPDVLYRRRYRNNSTMTGTVNKIHFCGYAFVCREMLAIKCEVLREITQYTRNLFKSDIVNLWPQLSAAERAECREELQLVLKAVKQKRCFGSMQTAVICYMWPLYSLYRKYVYKKQLMGERKSK